MQNDKQGSASQTLLQVFLLPGAGHRFVRPPCWGHPCTQRTHRAVWLGHDGRYQGRGLLLVAVDCVILRASV